MTLEEELEFLQEQIDLKRTFIAQSIKRLKDLRFIFSKGLDGIEYKSSRTRKYLIKDIAELRRGIEDNFCRMASIYMWLDASENFYADCM